MFYCVSLIGIYVSVCTLYQAEEYVGGQRRGVAWLAGR